MFGWGFCVCVSVNSPFILFDCSRYGSGYRMFYGTKIQFAKTKLEQVSLNSGVKVCCYSKQCNCSYNFLTKSFENYLT